MVSRHHAFNCGDYGKTTESQSNVLFGLFSMRNATIDLGRACALLNRPLGIESFQIDTGTFRCPGLGLLDCHARECDP